MIEIYLVTFISLSVTYINIPITNKIGKLLKITDRQDSRKPKKKSLVRLGGLGIILGIFSSVLIVTSLYPLEFTQYNIFFWPILIGGFICFLIGLADDIFNISPWIRLILQIIVASICWNYGLKVEQLDFSWLNIDNNLTIDNSFISLSITIMWIVGTINAINWMDGIDGLASGLTTIISAFIIIIGLSFDNQTVVLIASSLLGSSIGFLRYNSFPAKILMGDGGSYLYGFLLASLSLLLTSNDNGYLNLNIGFPLLALPILDMSYVIFKRLINNKSPFHPDSNHFHHRIMRVGLNQKFTVFSMYAVCQWLGFICLFIEGIVNYELMIFSTLILLSFIIRIRFKAKENKLLT